MSILATGSRLTLCMSNGSDRSVPNRAKFTIVKDPHYLLSFLVFDTKEMGIDTYISEDPSPYARPTGLKGNTLEEWRTEMLADGKKKGDTLHDCQDCKHRLACLIEPRAIRLFESKS